MPLFLNIDEENTRIWVWQIDGSEGSLQKSLPLNFQEGLTLIKAPLARLHYLSTRYLLKNYAKVNFIDKDANGMPITGKENEFISISHDNDFSAVALSLKKIGIDVQEVTGKINKIASRFVHKEDKTYIKDEEMSLTLIWAAKEAVFKYLQKTGVVFKEELKINQTGEDSLEAFFLRENEEEKILLKFCTFDNYFLVYTA